MAKNDGYSQYVCDRCGATLYAQPSAPDAQQWRQAHRISADNVDVTRWLCPSCAAGYRELAQRQDTEFGNWISGRE